MKIKIKVTYDEDLYFGDGDCVPQKKDCLIGLFDDLKDAEKAAENLIKKSEKDYHFVRYYEHPYEEDDIMKTYKTEEINNEYYCIDIYFNLVLS